MPGPVVFTIGHSNHSIETFLGLLRSHEIRHLADVRSQPYSRRFPQFNIKALQARLLQEGIQYTYLGNYLGGRPKDSDFYDMNGELFAERLTTSPGFAQGLQRMMDIASQSPTTIMCAEEDPGRCHRGTILTPALESRDLTVQHIRKPKVQGASDKELRLF